ncbi:hypothetical protein [Texcoconibacillus texcoconensis]|uniref:Uncharacterized protein n=1 Tax=Texcoconibacillus texcoconensis TaxID=1095777 RepID=A0A840QTX8_9BACI|nr:hypothetical protein [Texcoconibacillus texcoconensis]MBB5174717.1 hypothetical protein [Texcoconibacillus texcoconensis]
MKKTLFTVLIISLIAVSSYGAVASADESVEQYDDTVEINSDFPYEG